MNNDLLIGYDIGTKTIKAVYGTDLNDKKTIKIEHFSDPQGVIEKIEKKISAGNRNVNGYATGRYGDTINWGTQQITVIDWTKPVIRYCHDHYNEGIRYIIDIGAAGLSLLELKDGKFHRFATNSICASGTGSFLDQQMIRMGLGFEAVDKMEVSKRVPSIASRCAVFAKSDLIHRQQEGYTIQELWNGLVKGMAEACFITLLRGDNLNGKVLFLGGLVKNRLFLHYFSKLLAEDTLIVPEQPDTFLALANFYYAHLRDSKSALDKEFNYAEKKAKKDSNTAFEKPLNPPKSAKDKYYSDQFGNEITIYPGLHKLIKANGGSNESDNGSNGHASIPTIFGVDIGSTSTKAALIHKDSGALLIGLYRKTHGNPISAYQKLLKGINRLTLENPYRFVIKGMGTTGSGRKIVSAFAGGDQCVNEITAHLQGALIEVPDVRTIFEIGGQDSKYIFVEDGWMKDANMNYVCAAGTGSFLEEQAQNLNFELNEFEDLCRGVPAPKTNDRCTVFMEQDSKKLLIDGHSKSEVVASLLYSVCKNYLHRVVQNRPIEEPILFLGATARNKGLVEAFSNILQKEINTSTISHLTGAIGVAEIVRKDIVANETKFKGFSLHADKIEFKERNCTDCHNNCRIIYFESASGTVSWGYQCGKEGLDKTDKKPNKRHEDYFRAVKKMNTLSPSTDGENKTIYIPKALFYYSHNYLWQKFWETLGFKVEILPDSNKEILATALSYSPNETCFPLKMAIGHIIHAIKSDKTPLFLPYLIRDTNNEAATNSYFCPMTQSLPAIIKSILQYNGISDEGLVAPIVDLSNPDDNNIESLHSSLKSRYNIGKERIADSFRTALSEYKTLQKKLLNQAQKAIKEIEKTPVLSSERHQEPVLVIIGRSYNLYDDSLNLGLIKDTKAYGYKMIPADMMPFERETIGDDYRNMYWSYGQKVIAIAQEILKHPNLYPIFLTNFNCGPDSFILSMLEEIWKHKPYLILELDEHSGNAGYLTRIEAFLDRIKSHNHLPPQSETEQKVTKNSLSVKPSQKTNELKTKQKTLIIPPMNPYGTVLVSGAFRKFGYNAVPMVKEDINTFHLGKSYLRGSECLPAASTLGSVLDYCEKNRLMSASKDSKNSTSFSESISVFMPCASGPCRFGQYGHLHEMILNRNNINADILSLNSENDYAGFSPGLRLQIFRAIILTDIFVKLGCKLRPYEKRKGEVNELLNQYLKEATGVLASKQKIGSLLKRLRRAIDRLNIDLSKPKPLVGIVGEIYVRSSPFSNDNLIEKIEDHEAEAWLTPLMEWLHYTSYLKTSKQKGLMDKISDELSNATVHYHETKYYGYFNQILSDRQEPDVQTMIDKAKPYINEAIRGEAVLTVGRAICFIDQGAKMIVNVAPFGCMPGTVSSIILKNLAMIYSTPMVSLYYDGYVGFDTQLEQYLNNLN